MPPVLYGTPYFRQIARTSTAISGYLCAGISGNMWCSIWWLRWPLKKCRLFEPSKLAEPSSCRRYQPARVSRLISSSLKVAVPSGKCPQKITAKDHTLRARLATALPASTGSAPGPASSGKSR